MNKDCTDCDSSDDTYSCPYCHHNCNMQAKTINSDEDGHCCMCDKDCLMGPDGLSMVPL